MLYSELTHDHGIERDDLTSCSPVMVELWTRKREMGGDLGNHHEKLGLKMNLMSESIYHTRYGWYDTRSDRYEHRYEVF
jgi:hypothetical protein